MNQRVRLSSLLVIFICLAFTCAHGGSNISGYPRHSCQQPTKPAKPSSFSGRTEIDSYINEVDSYRLRRQSYYECMKEYLENANKDIKEIKEKASDAISEAKQ